MVEQFIFGTKYRLALDCHYCSDHIWIHTSYATYHFIKHKDIIDTVIADIQKQNLFVTIESENAGKERIRTEVTRWANPILGAVQDLEGKLKNILEDRGYLALTKDYREVVNPNWSISYDYFLHSSLYVF